MEMSRTTASPRDALAGAKAWSVPVRCVVSALLVWHLVAVILGPLSLPPSILASALMPLFKPYIRATYLDHSYKFFAPDPGPSHLIRYDVMLADGSHKRGTFPSLQDNWPRLLYHRHFMLTEFIGSAPPVPTFDPRQEWHKQPLWEWQGAYAKSYAQHLLDKYHGRSVSLELVQHALAPPERVLAGAKLDDPASYRARPLGSFVGGAP
jgi:hypothetical protein